MGGCCRQCIFPMRMMMIIIIIKKVNIHLFWSTMLWMQGEEIWAIEVLMLCVSWSWSVLVLHCPPLLITHCILPSLAQVQVIKLMMLFTYTGLTSPKAPQTSIFHNAVNHYWALFSIRWTFTQTTPNNYHCLWATTQRFDWIYLKAKLQWLNTGFKLEKQLLYEQKANTGIKFNQEIY